MKLIRWWVLIGFLSLGGSSQADEEWDAFVEEQKKIYEGMQSPELRAARELFDPVVDGLGEVMSASFTVFHARPRGQGPSFQEEVLRMAARPENFHDELAAKIVRDWMKETKVELLEIIEKETESGGESERLPFPRGSNHKRALQKINRAADLLEFSLDAPDEEWLALYKERWLTICQDWRKQLILATRRVKTEGTRSRGDWSDFTYAKMFLNGYEELSGVFAVGRRAHTMTTMRGWAVQWEIGGKRDDGLDPFGDPRRGPRRRPATPR